MPQQLEDRVNDCLPDPLAFDVAFREALVGTLSGNDRRVVAVPLHEQEGGAPGIDVRDHPCCPCSLSSNANSAAESSSTDGVCPSATTLCR